MKNRIEPQSETWMCVKEYAEGRIQELRDTIDNLNTPEQTRRDCVVRLAEIRALLGIEDPIKPIPTTKTIEY